MNVITHTHILGIALILAFFSGKFSRLIKIPKVTIYIFIGIILGPSIFNILNEEVSNSFEIIKEAAFGLILFNIGGEFHRELFGRMAWKHIKFVLLMCLLIFLITSSIIFGFSIFSDLTIVQKIAFSSFLGLVAIAAAPPTTLLVIKEYNAEGPLTHLITLFLALGSIIAITGTHMLTVIFETFGIWQKTIQAPLWIQILSIIWSIVGSFIVGTLLGLLLSYWEQKEKKKSEVLLAVICFILFGKTLSYYLGLEPLLVSLFLGFSLVNTSPTGEHIHYIIKETGLSIYAIFFIMAGAHLDLGQQLKTVGVLSIGYLVARIIGISLSSYISARVQKEEKIIGKYMGPAILSHAGAALAIVLKLQNQADPSAQAILNVVMMSIIFFEILGPLTLKYALKSTKEIENPKFSKQNTARSILTLKELSKHFLENIGIGKEIEMQSFRSIRYIVDNNVIAIKENATFKQVQEYINEQRTPIFPVVNDKNIYLGIISLRIIENTMANEPDTTFILANQLIGSKYHVHETDNYDYALEVFQKSGLLALPVIKEGTKVLVGLLYYQDTFMSK